MAPQPRRWTGKVFIATSLDGFIARQDGDISWLTDGGDDEGHAPESPGVTEDLGYAEHMADVDHVVMGRGTYDKVLTFDAWPYPDRQVVVLSSALATDDERITIVRSVSEAAQCLSEHGARVVYVDGGATVQAFLRAGLIDTIVVTRAPILIGGGLPLFGPLDDDVQLVHEGTVASDAGLVQSRYRVVTA